jgi:hypothetical protein
MPVTSAFTRVLRERVWHAETGASHASERHRRSARPSIGGEIRNKRPRRRKREGVVAKIDGLPGQARQ